MSPYGFQFKCTRNRYEKTKHECGKQEMCSRIVSNSLLSLTTPLGYKREFLTYNKCIPRSIISVFEGGCIRVACGPYYGESFAYARHVVRVVPCLLGLLMSNLSLICYQAIINLSANWLCHSTV